MMHKIKVEKTTEIENLRNQVATHLEMTAKDEKNEIYIVMD